MAIAAITCFYNPCGYQRLARNYWAFREHLKGIELTTVELSFDGHFVIPDAIHIHGSEQHLMWQKERLLNIAIDSLPPRVDQVAWIDADVVFLNPNWVEDTQRALEVYPIVQLFERWHYLDAEGRIDLTHLGHVRAREQEPTKKGFIGATGGAWAARREAIPEGLEDRHVLGGSDGMMLYAWEDSISEWLLDRLNPEWKRHYLAYAARAHRRIRGHLGYTKGDALHLYHGTRTNRNYVGRWGYLTDHGFDPLTDIAMDDNGLWKWASDKPEMQLKVKDYFVERREDE